ncbi:hypothetical protein P5673_019011 [Acropora cervicornis]|uniref:Uncharacterized protein n=1 Tax=Acropora cervicornis TaxID=6130 RepID=A0AAD9V2J0_ACRCE|nr:hypothetical protein P5673_019011 [Acropora cervicornis]
MARDKHLELKEKMSGLQKEIRQLQQEHSDAESKLKPSCESRKKASTSFFAVILKARNLIKYSDRVSLDRDLLILEKALNGKIPEFDMSEDWHLPVLIEQYRKRNVDKRKIEKERNYEEFTTLIGKCSVVLLCCPVPVQPRAVGAGRARTQNKSANP